MLPSIQSSMTLVLGVLPILSGTATATEIRRQDSMAQRPGVTTAQPKRCTTKITDCIRSTTWMLSHSCYVRTSTTPPASCPTFTRDPDVVCADWATISTVTVPCATSCCPVTPVVTMAGGPCPTSEPCPRATDWFSVTTGACPEASSPAPQPEVIGRGDRWARWDEED